MKNYQDLADAEVLDMASIFGPGFVGAYLFERAEWVRQHNPNGAMGPGAVGKVYEPSAAALADLVERKMVVDVNGVESVAWEATASPTVQVTEKRGPGRPKKVV